MARINDVCESSTPLMKLALLVGLGGVTLGMCTHVLVGVVVDGWVWW